MRKLALSFCFVFAFAFMYVCVKRGSVCLWRSGTKDYSFHYVVSRDWTQVVRLCTASAFTPWAICLIGVSVFIFCLSSNFKNETGFTEICKWVLGSHSITTHPEWLNSLIKEQTEGLIVSSFTAYFKAVVSNNKNRGTGSEHCTSTCINIKNSLRLLGVLNSGKTESSAFKEFQVESMK